MFSNNTLHIEQYSDEYFKQYPEVKKTPKEPIPRRRFHRSKECSDLKKLEEKPSTLTGDNSTLKLTP